MTYSYKQFIFGDALAWYKDVKPCGLRKAIKQATGTTCFVYQRGELVQTLDVKGLFQDYLKRRGYNPGYHDWFNEKFLCGEIQKRLHSKQDQDNKLLQKIRALV